MNYKKAIVITSFLFFFGFLFNFAPSNAKAITVDEIQAQIQQLLQQITQLQQQLASMTGQSVSWCHNFNTNLRIGDTGSEVEALQTALKKEGFTLGNDKTGEFGEYTASAVVAFQEKYKDEILTPLHLVHGTGYVGSSTRAKLNKLYGCGVVQPPTGKYINIISPNGGEVWEIGKTYEIKWETGGFSQSAPVQIRIYNVNYSSEAGDCSEYVISNTINTGKYYWTPKLWGKCPEGNGYKIKIYIEGSGDESDNTFSIVSSNISDWKTYTNYKYGIELKYPADWRVEEKNSCYDTDPNHNCLAEIQFVPPSTYKFSWVSLRMYGKFWHLEGRETGADGCRLIADYKINDKYLYRLSTCMGVGQEGTESIYNAMLATIKFSNLTSCTDSDGGKNYYMRGTVSDRGKSYTDYCIDSSTLREYFCLPYTPGGLGGVAQEDYKCPNGCKDGACVLATKSINIISPNGGEIWDGYQLQKITWSSFGNVYSKIDIQIAGYDSQGNLIGWKVIAKGVPTSQGYYYWVPSGAPLYLPSGFSTTPSKYKIMIREAIDQPVAISDMSDNYFTITSNVQPSITLLSPNGGEKWEIGKTYSIKWTARNLPSLPSNSRIGIILVKATGEDLIPPGRLFELGVNNAITAYWGGGSVDWKIPSAGEISPGSYKLKIRVFNPETGMEYCEDISDAPFNIVAPNISPLTLLSPNGGETWMVGETRRITWTASGVNYVRIYIINTSGIVSGSGNTNYIYDGLIPASQGYYDWTISQNQLPGGNSLPGNYKIRIDGVNEPYGPVIAQDFSDNSFTIVNPCTDSDGGMNIFIKGHTIGYDPQAAPGYNNVDIWDKCYNNNAVYEYGCRNGYFYSELNYCPSGYTCQDGACK